MLKFPKSLTLPWHLSKLGIFAGRTKEIDILAPYFDNPDHLVVMPPITGPVGIGKTQLAHQLIAQHIAKYDHVVWINAATQKDIEISYHQIAEALRIQLLLNEDPSKAVEKVIASVHNRLKDKHVLYVFDNAPDLKAIQHYFQNGHVLITSRSSAIADWKSVYYDAPLALAPFSEEEALQLAKKMEQDSTDPYLKELIQLLPTYPLVLNPLLSFILGCKATPEAFLKKMQQNTKLIKQLKEKPATETTYRAALSYIMQNTLKVLQSRGNGKAVFQLAQQVASLDVQSIPISFVLLALGKAEEKVQTIEALVILETNGLIAFNPKNISMHSAIQTIIAHHFPLSAKQSTNLVARYAKYDIAKVAAVSSFSAANLARQMLPHGEKLLKYVQNQPGEDVDTAKCYQQLSYICRQQKDYQKAITYGVKACNLFEKVHGENTPHTDIAHAYGTLGSLYDDQGLYELAIACYQKVLCIYSVIYRDSPHPESARVYSNLGSIYHAQGQYMHARELYQKALDIEQKVYGDNPHPDIAFSYYKLGLLYYHQELYDRAIAFYQKSLDMQRKVYGDKPHPATMGVYRNLVEAYKAKGDIEKANKFYAQGLALAGEYKEIAMRRPKDTVHD